MPDYIILPIAHCYYIVYSVNQMACRIDSLLNHVEGDQQNKRLASQTLCLGKWAMKQIMAMN